MRLKLLFSRLLTAIVSATACYRNHKVGSLRNIRFSAEKRNSNRLVGI
jgi:elongation factor P--beta-lysine ligase